MKVLKFIIIIIIALTSYSEIGIALNNGKQQVTKAIHGVLKRKETKSPDKRPRLPNRQIIEYIYDGELLTIEFVLPEGECLVILTDQTTGIPMRFNIDSEELIAEVCVGEINESSIELITDTGNSYIGMLLNE